VKHPTNTSLRIGRALLAALALGFAATSAALASDTRYYVNDHLATTVGIADAAGEIAAIEADAFGSPLSGGANADRFTGKPYDEDLGAYVFPFRNYRADEARWMSSDPSGFPDGLNGRAYMATPNLSFDATGLYKITPTGNITAPSQHQVIYVPSGQSTTSVTVTGNFWLTYLFGGSNGPAATGTTVFYYTVSLSITNYITGEAIATGDPAFAQFTVTSDLENGARVVAQTTVPSVSMNLAPGSYGTEITIFESWSDYTTKGASDFRVRAE
jgi:RHS repeat-associated protein